MMIRDLHIHQHSLSSEIVKWKVETREDVDRCSILYSVIILNSGGDRRKPWGKYPGVNE
ncbi:MAG: hypothetical protein IPP52_09390 [Ignavibacteria bacterium]|nr:hypothetical protein [Ignavibacteria bacterium]